MASKPLVIVESPAKARTIGKFLGNKYTVKASMGHVRDLPKSGLGVDVENDFETTWVAIKDREKVLKDLRERIDKTDILYLATDPDREGEAIAWHLVESLLGDDHAHIEVKRVVFHEITDAAIHDAFSHPSDVNSHRVDAYRTRRVLDRLMGYQLSPLLWKKLARGLSAGRVQSVAVRLVAEREREIRAFVPDEYWEIKGRFGSGENAFTASLDKVDGAKPTLGNADDARAVLARLDAAAGGLELVPGDPAAEDKQDRTARFPTLKGTGPFQVTGLEQKARKEKPKPPFITSTLQQAAASSYGFAAKRTMRVAQQLYEGMEVPGEGAVGLITYMRTDSFNISKQAKDAARGLIGKLYGDRYVPAKPNAYTSKKGAQEAHEAIRPTDPARTPDSLKSVLKDEQWKLYDLVWRRFMASQMTPAEQLVTTVELTLDGVTFRASGRVMTFDGHTRVYGGGRTDQLLPALAEGQELGADVDADQHFTSPPRRYTEASLVRALENFGIGRPSTYASILSTIVDRGYVDHGEEAMEDDARRRYAAGEDDAAVAAVPEDDASDDDDEGEVQAGPQKRKSKAFHATHLGEVVTDLLLPYFGQIVDTDFTSNLESQLDRIADGELDWHAVIKEFYEKFADRLKEAEEGMEPYWSRPILLDELSCGKPDENTGEPCPAPMAILFNRFGAYLGCSRYPDCRNTLSLTGRPKAEAELTEHTCRKKDDAGKVCGRQMERKVNRWGKAFLACTGFKDKHCDGTVSLSTAEEPLWPVETSVPCPDCATELVVKRSRRGKFLACPRYPKCRGTLSLPSCTHTSRTGKACAKPMTEPVAGGKMACKTHPGVRLEPPKKARSEKDKDEPKGKKATTKKASRKKATTKKASRRTTKKTA